MSITAWILFYLIELLCWWCFFHEGRKEGQPTRPRHILWMIFAAFSTCLFLVGLSYPDVRLFLLRFK